MCKCPEPLKVHCYVCGDFVFEGLLGRWSTNGNFYCNKCWQRVGFE